MHTVGVLGCMQDTQQALAIYERTAKQLHGTRYAVKPISISKIVIIHIYKCSY